MSKITIGDLAWRSRSWPSPPRSPARRTIAAMKAARPGAWEYELEAAIEDAFIAAASSGEDFLVATT